MKSEIISPLLLPDLTFPTVQFSIRQTPWDLKCLLYRGAAKVRANEVGRMIESERFGGICTERIPFVTKIHEAINAKLVAGGSEASAELEIRLVRNLVSWVEENGHTLSMEHAEKSYLAWSDSLYHRTLTDRGYSPFTAYNAAVIVGGIIDDVFERNKPICEITRLRRPKEMPTATGVKAERESLSATLDFGHFIQDICDGLTLSVVFGPLPIRVPLRRGGHLIHWSRLKPADEIEETGASGQPSQHNTCGERSDIYGANRLISRRFPVLNLRIAAEMIMFVAQTGMNVKQVLALRRRHFSYKATIEGYEVREYKRRRQGEVLFEIYADYRPHFERYLSWRAEIFPDSDVLFPFISKDRIEGSRFRFTSLEDICERHGVRWISLGALRKTRVNWLLRKSGDPEVTSEMAQHSVKVLREKYEMPSLQVLVAEATVFWRANDPTLARTISVAPGECNAAPDPAPAIPRGVTPPDCVRPSGCLWCRDHRDIDTQDYVWALASFRQLKIIERTKYSTYTPSKQELPVDKAIEKLSEKILWFSKSNAKRKAWVDEALLRIEEGDYHEDWADLLAEAQG